MFAKLVRYVAAFVSVASFASMLLLTSVSLNAIDSVITRVDAWGPEGHTAVARIAQEQVSKSALTSISTIIPGGDLGSIANWADTVRSNPEWHWSEPLHFIDAPSWDCNYVPSRDCYNEAGEFDYCVDGAIRNYTERISASKMVSAIDPTYLKFLVHFVGDIHQPLHCGFRDDRGGNSIKVHFLNHATNLHSLWDSGLIHLRITEDYGGNMDAWIADLVRSSMDRVAPDACVSCSTQWGNSSAILACSNAYVADDGTTHIQQGAQLDMNYYKRNIEVVESQIILGGLRLAALLNATLGDDRV